MSSRSSSDGSLPEPDPYQQILALVRRQVEEGPTRSAADADAAFRRITELTLKLFAEYVNEHGAAPLPSDHSLTATEAAVISTHLLRAVDIALFELAMWQSWSGAGEIGDVQIDSLTSGKPAERHAGE